MWYCKLKVRDTLNGITRVAIFLFKGKTRGEAEARLVETTLWKDSTTEKEVSGFEFISYSVALVPVEEGLLDHFVIN